MGYQPTVEVYDHMSYDDKSVKGKASYVHIYKKNSPMHFEAWKQFEKSEISQQNSIAQHWTVFVIVKSCIWYWVDVFGIGGGCIWYF